MHTFSTHQNGFVSLLELNDCGICTPSQENPSFLSNSSFFVLVYLIEGSVELTAMSRFHVIKEGSFIICRPYEIKSFIVSKDLPYKYFWATFSGHNSSDLVTSLNLSSKQEYSIGKNPEVSSKISMLLSECKSQTPHTQIMRASLFVSLLCQMSRLAIHIPSSDKVKGRDKILPALNAINSDCTNNAGVDEYAKLCNLSSSYFTHLFTKIIGFSPMEYKQLQRINIAKNLLSTTNLSIKEISTIIGFKDPLYFGRCFKQSVGQTPSGFRANR